MSHHSVFKIGLCLLTSSLVLTGCMSTRVSFDPKWDARSKPVLEDYFDYYLLGLIGENEINLQKVCMDQKLYGMRRFMSFQDGFITAITLGIYTPMTVRVWCGDQT